MDLRVLVDLVTIIRRGRITSQKVIEYIDEFTEYNVHDGQDATSCNHADNRDGVEDPS